MMKRKELETTFPNDIRDGNDNTYRYSRKTIDVTTTTTAHSTSTVTIPLPFDIDVAIPSFFSIENMDIFQLILSFVGPEHYRFVALISHSFHVAAENGHIHILQCS